MPESTLVAREMSRRIADVPRLHTFGRVARVVGLAIEVSGLEMGLGGRTMRSRVVGWLCPDDVAKDKDYSVLYRIWAGTQRVLVWGDPKLAGGYGRLSMFAEPHSAT